MRRDYGRGQVACPARGYIRDNMLCIQRTFHAIVTICAMDPQQVFCLGKETSNDHQ
jgi:hypothetical protein